MTTEYTIAPKISFMLSGSDIHTDVWNWGAWDGVKRAPSKLKGVDEPVKSGYDALVRAMRSGEITKRGLRVSLDEEARKELIEFLEAMYVGARDSEDYNDMAAIRRAFKALGTEVMV